MRGHHRGDDDDLLPLTTAVRWLAVGTMSGTSQRVGAILSHVVPPAAPPPLSAAAAAGDVSTLRLLSDEHVRCARQ